MDPIEEKKLREALEEFKEYARKEMKYAHPNLNRCIHGASAFVDFLVGRKPRKGERYN